ncbi:hypothetical protein IJ531_06395 [bacterium]|nr:hypothetical protein [bacterium]
MKQDNNKIEYELPEDRWLQSHYTYIGNVFDTPEHQAALSKLKTVDERIAYKTAVLEKMDEELLSA